MTQKKKTNPILKAYIFSFGSFLLLCWIGEALIMDESTFDDPSGRFIAGITMFCLAIWSPSIGLIMFKKTLYGLLAGLGRFLIIAACAYSDYQMNVDMPEGQGGHAYLTFLGVMMAFVWGMVDLVLIYAFGDKQIKLQKAKEL